MSPTTTDRKTQSFGEQILPEGRFSHAIARALHRQYDETHAAVKTVVEVTGANERAVRNWFEAKNGPSGEYLIVLCRHSDEVFETVLRLAGRVEHLKARKLLAARTKLREMLAVLDELDAAPAPRHE
jgi:hypothetical protein